MTSFPPLRMAVEPASPGVRVVRTAGAFDRPAAERLLRLADAQIHLCATRDVAFRHLVVDLANVTRFDPGGLETFRSGWLERGDRGVRLHVAGCGGRAFLLPLGVDRLMRDFSTFPSLEAAISYLSPPGADLPSPRIPSDPGLSDPAGQGAHGRCRPHARPAVDDHPGPDVLMRR